MPGLAANFEKFTAAKKGKKVPPKKAAAKKKPMPPGLKGGKVPRLGGGPLDAYM